MGVALLLALLVIQLHALNQSVLISQAVRSVSTEQFADGFTGWQAAGWAVNIQIALSLTLSLAPLWLPKGFTWFIGSQNCASSSRSS
jgi:hypothetical protein